MDTITWFQSGKSMMALAKHWIKEGYLPEASWLGAKQALAYFKEWQLAQAKLKELERVKFFLESRERIRKEKYLERLRAQKVRSDHGIWDAVERTGWRPALEVVEDRPDKSDVMPELQGDPYFRAA